MKMFNYTHFSKKKIVTQKVKESLFLFLQTETLFQSFSVTIIHQKTLQTTTTPPP
jgi:hypothetical protein